jgi:hypothetical protein
VSKAEKIGKLEALLARVRSRATEPRKAPSAATAPVAVAPPVAADAPLPAMAVALEEDEITLAQPIRSARGATEADIVLEVEVQEVTADTVIGVPVEEVMAPEALGSRERLVAAEPAEAVLAQAPVEEAAPEILADESDVEEAGELIEEAPLSSRRPVGPQPEERLAEMAFGAHGEDEPPRHTPPPESGRLPAAPALEFDPDVTGVREATPIAPVRAHESDAAAHASPAPSRELEPQVTHATLPSGDGVAEVIGKAQGFQPSTFVALLDASLAL